MAFHIMIFSVFTIAFSGAVLATSLSRPAIPHLGFCEESGSVCAEGLTCAGGPPKRCISFMGEGQKCETDPWWICQEGLQCVSKVCRKPVIAQGGVCDAPGSLCGTGLTCAGGPPKKCINLMGEGQSCLIEPWWICQDGLECVSNVCRKPAIARGGVCEAAGSVCATGLTCAGGPPKKCVELMGDGQKCETDPWWICQDGLECVSKVCRKPVIAQGEVCEAPGSVCAAGLTCAGGPPKKCIKLMGEGQKCQTDPWWICQESLRCVSRRCVKRGVLEGRRCTRGRTPCQEGLVCATRRRRRRGRCRRSH